ncbi:MAG: 23S rRNA (cytidine(2498)-2'-O)-methyltransferase RlmM [Tahibacter sp.]
MNPHLQYPADAMLIYCRAGFEGECAQDLDVLAAEGGLVGYSRAERGAGYIEFVLGEPATLDVLFDACGLQRQVFARQALARIATLDPLPREDRLSPLLASLPKGLSVCDAWVEAPDSDAGGELTALCRSFGNALVQGLKREKRIDARSPLRLHVLFTSGQRCIVALADVAQCAPWPQGIARLKFPREAPSRSTLKLDEALLVLLDEDQRTRWLQPGMSAVDLGASPGGWTWQLVRRSLRVTAVDNGPMDAALMESGLVTHLREDGFTYRPTKFVDWLICDMVEQPRRVADLIGQWLAQRWCQRTIFNLKLPMKKRYLEVQECFARMRQIVAQDGGELDIRARQLYHDREEITVFAQRVTRKGR